MCSNRPTRVLIADRECCCAALRALMSTHPEIEVVGEARDGEDAVRQAEDLRPDAVLMEARLRAIDGVEATRTIKANWPATRVVILTAYAAYRADAVAAGADAFLIKGRPTDELFAALVSR